MSRESSKGLDYSRYAKDCCGYMPPWIGASVVGVLPTRAEWYTVLLLRGCVGRKLSCRGSPELSTFFRRADIFKGRAISSR